MRTIREILRLKWACQRSNREIAQSCHIARSSVGECLARATAPGYLDIANALRRVGTYQPDKYDAFQGKCGTHTGQSGEGMFWTIRRR